MQKTTLGYWFPPKKPLKYCLILALTLVLNSCSHEEEVKSTQTSNVKIIKSSFDDLAGWQNEDFAKVIAVFGHNCEKILSQKGSYLANSKIKIETAPYQDICRRFAKQNIENANKFKDFVQNEFAVYAIADGANPVGKFTSYYEATLRASKTKSAKYKYPIYGKPKDLIEINLRDFGADLPDTRLVGRVKNSKFVPYYSRREIENDGVDAPVLMWGDDLVDIHVMQIQGSAVAQMDDGSKIRIGYAESNGRKFKGIGSILLEKKILKPKDASMDKIRSWLKKNPQKAKELMENNERFIFQRLVNSDGPIGAFGISLTAGRSLAVDNSIVPLGAMMWLDTVDADKNKIEKIVFAQDIGSAIKGVVRGDYFWGNGEEAFYSAGRMNSAGKYYIFVPRSSAVQVD